MLKYSREYSGLHYKDSNETLKKEYTGYTEIEIYNDYSITEKEKVCITTFLKDIKEGKLEKDIFKAEDDLYECTPDGKMKESLHFHLLGPHPMTMVNLAFLHVSSTEMNKVISYQFKLLGSLILILFIFVVLFLRYGTREEKVDLNS